MNRALHIGTVLAVALHMLCGCCLHHPHAYGRLFDTKAPAVEAPCPSHHGSAEPDLCCDSSSQQQRCHGNRCVFTRPDSNDALDLSIGHGCLNPVCVSPGTATLGRIDRVDSSLDNLGEPIPLHLLNQALLL